MIGKENLPNVYIEKIVLDADSEETTIRINLAMFDNSLSYSWFQREQCSNLKIKIKLASSREEIESLANGTSSLFDFQEGPRVNIVSAQAPNDEVHLDNEPLIKKIYTTSFKVLNASLNNLNVYASCYIDFNGFVGNREFNKFYGPMSAESVFVSNKVNLSSTYFVYEGTEQEYMGPVHQSSNGRWMEGSTHSGINHRFLTKIEEENLKIIDNRED